MTDLLTARQFREQPGTEDWRPLARGASAVFRTISHRDGAAFAERIGALADVVRDPPDVDLRRGAVVVRVLTREVWALTARDARRAAAISMLAHELGLTADHSAAQDVDLTIDALDRSAIMPFWAAALGDEPMGDDDLIDPHWRSPFVWFQQMDGPRPLRNRIHLDVFVPGDVRETRQAAMLAAGGRLVNDAFAPRWWTMADGEGNEVDLVSWEEPGDELPAPWVTPGAFEAEPGVDDWRVIQGASTYYPGASRDARFVPTVAALADAAGLPVYMDVRPRGVTLRLGVPEDDWITTGHLPLARAIQAEARALGLVAEPSAVRDVQLTFDALDIPALQTFWGAALAYEKREETDLFDPLLRGPSVFFQQLDAPREQRNRIHVDVFVPEDLARLRVDAALAAGGRLVSDAQAPFWWTLADPEGNEVDVAVTVGREEAFRKESAGEPVTGRTGAGGTGPPTEGVR